MKTMTHPARQETPAQPLGPKKTLFVMVTVVGCIAILWPKVFYPMIVGPAPKPAVLKDHRGSGCCDVVLDTEEFANVSIVFNTSAERQLFRKHLHVLAEEKSIRQERPPHLRPEGIHPAMRERGRAIPVMPTVPITGDRAHNVPPIPPKIIDGRPGPIPGMRPPMGAGSHQQPAPRSNSMGFIMPLYTVGIVAFFIYTIMKLVCKKSPVAPYNEVKPDPKFRQTVFTPEEDQALIKRPDDGTTKLAWKDHDANYIYHHEPHHLYDHHVSLNNNPYYENGHCHRDHYPPSPPPQYEPEPLPQALPATGTKSEPDPLPTKEKSQSPPPAPRLSRENSPLAEESPERSPSPVSREGREKSPEAPKLPESDKAGYLLEESEATTWPSSALDHSLDHSEVSAASNNKNQSDDEKQEKTQKPSSVDERVNKYKTQARKPSKKTEEVYEGESSHGGTPIKLKLTRIEMEYKVKEKQQLVEIELLRQKLEQTELAMANIIARMDTIPGQKKDTTKGEETKPEVKDNEERVEEVRDETESKKGKIEDDEVEREELDPIVLDTPVTPDSQILVSDTDTVAEEVIDEALYGSPEDPAVVLSGRMTLSLISPHLPHPEKQHPDEPHVPNGGDKEEMQVEVSNIVLMEKLEKEVEE